MLLVSPKRGGKCVHCRTGRVNRPRGLCWTCYYTPGMRERYPPVDEKQGRTGLLATGCRLPARPTETRPGSIERMMVYRRRLEAGESLFHPWDDNGAPRPDEPFKGCGSNEMRWKPGEPTGLEDAG